MEQSVIESFVRIRRQLNLFVTKKLKPFDLGPKQAKILRELHCRGSMSVSELAKETDTDATATGRVIETLIKKGWVLQQHDPADRRRWNILLSDQGNVLVGNLDILLREIATHFCQPFNHEEKSIFASHLERIAEHLEHGI